MNWNRVIIVSCLLLFCYFIGICFRTVKLLNAEVFSLELPRDSTSLLPYPISISNFNEGLSKDSTGVYFRSSSTKRNIVSFKGDFYHPTAISLAALMDYNEFVLSGDSTSLASFWNNIEWVVKSQDTHSGKWEFDFDHVYNGKTINGPWASALTQGTCISALIRAFNLSHDSLYIEKVEKGLIPLGMYIKDGGVISGNSFGSFPEEYPYTNYENRHVLNGALYGMIGLKEAAVILDFQLADSLFNCFNKTLGKVITDYDLASWSKYDLDRPNFRNHYNYANPRYHKLHAVQLELMTMYTGESIYKETSLNFEQDLDGITGYIVTILYLIYGDLALLLNSLRSFY